MTSADRRVRAAFSRFLRWHMLAAKPSRRSKALFERIARHQYGPVVDRIRDSDLVVFMGEGTMKGDHFLRGLRLLQLPQVAIDLGKPVISLNQTIFAGSNSSFRRVLAAVLERMDVVAVREPASLEYCQSIGLDGGTLIPDSAFRTQPSDRPLAELLDPVPTRPFICVTSAAACDFSTIAPILRQTLEFAKHRDLQVCALFWMEDWIRDLELIQAEIGGGALLRPKHGVNYRDVSRILQAAVAYVGGRYHTAIQAAIVGTPFVAVPTESHKGHGVLDLLGYPLPIVAFDDPDGIADALKRLLTEREELSALLLEATRRIGELRTRQLRLLGGKIQSLLPTGES